VLFNGIDIGTVNEIFQDPKDPDRVTAVLSIDGDKPVKEDTKAAVGVQGLTGLGYMKLTGGSMDKPDLFDTPGPAKLTAEPGAPDDLFAAAGELMGRADIILKEIEDLVKTNRAAVDSSVANVQSFTEALSQNTDKIATFVDSVAGAADGITTLSKRLEGVVDKSEAILGAVEPDDVRQTIAQLRETADNVSAFSKSLSSRSGDIDRMVTQFSAISSDINAFSASLTGIGERADTLLADVGDKAGKILDAVDPDAVSRAIGNIDRVAAAIEPEKVGTTIDGLASFSQTLSNRQEDIDTLVTRLSTIASDVSGFSARLPSMGEKVDNLLAAVDTEKVTQSVDSVHQFATALGENSDDIDAIVANVRAVSERFDGLTAKAESLIAKLDTMAGGENGGIVEEASRTLTAIREAAESFDKQAQAIGSGVGRFSNQGLRDLQEFVNEGRRTVSRLDRVISNLGDDPSQILFGGKGVPEYRGNRR
jgi:phospholipid/cholesterol/gamma-HCH transport system substrate-binding protein